MTNEIKKNNAEVKKINGSLTYDNEVIQKIIGLTLKSVDGLLAVNGGFFSNIADKLVNSSDVTKGINVEVGKKQVAVDLDIVAEYKKVIPEVYTEIKNKISEEISRMTQLEVVEVNVNVVDIQTKEEYEESNVSLQDKLSETANSVGDFTSNQVDKLKNTVSNGTEKVKEVASDVVARVQ